MPAKRSLRALDWVNLFMADVKDGVGIYLSVYLLTEHLWKPGQIGIVMSIPSIVGIIVQTWIGAFIDNTKYKRQLLIVGSIAIAFSAIIVIQWTTFWPIVSSQVLVGIFQTVYPPAVAAITLGIVGQKNFSSRIGRNESFNHGGNMMAALANLVIAAYMSYKGIFYFSIFQCLLIIIPILLLREKDIDHYVARAAQREEDSISITSVQKLFSDRNTLMFLIAMFLFNLANGAMLPLIGQKIGLITPNNSSIYLSVCIMIAQAIMVIVARIIGRKAYLGRKKLFMIAFLILPIRPLLVSLFNNPFILTCLQLLDGMAAGIYGVMIIIMTSDLSQGTGRFNLLQGAIYTTVGIGVALSSFIGGMLADSYGYDICFRCLAVASIIALIFFHLFVRETKREDV